jgi:uncharacterized protein
MSTLDEGMNAYECEDYDTAFNMIMPFAENGNPDAQTIIGGMYFAGRGVHQDFTEAERWYRLAAENGQVIAQNNLASMLVGRDSSEAVKWASLAAKNNLPFAQSFLGDIYSGALNLTDKAGQALRNPTEAAMWYTRAANGGDSIACHRLGDMYENGFGVNKDEEQAYSWYLKAAEYDYIPAQKFLGKAFQEGLLRLSPDLEKSKYWFQRAKENEEGA